MQIIVTMEKMLCAKPDNKWYFFRALMGGDGVPETTVICKGSMGWQPREMELDGIANRCNGQTSSGVRTRITWTDNEIVYPTVDGAKSSGTVIQDRI